MTFMTSDAIKKLFDQVKRGKLSPDEAVQRLRHLPFEDLGFANVDHHRTLRVGMPEVIFGPRKTPRQFVEIFARLAQPGHHVLAPREVLVQARVVIVCAGMEGALPSVVGGLVGVPVIAVPTSVGYGASYKGIAALLGMLNSCASNVSVVNIDNGFGAGYVASIINRLE